MLVVHSRLPSQSKLRWYQGLERYCWIVLIVAALGWLFDTMDQNLFNLVRNPSIHELLRPHIQDSLLLEAETRRVGGWVTALFLVGWSAGGFLFGILGDRLGRTRTMILTILIYAGFTGLSSLAWNWQSYALLRFMTGLGVGGEWAAGAAIVAEVFPERSRPMALGTLQALSAVGNMMAAAITFTLAGLSWRYVYLVGALPALLVVWIRRSIKEPQKWIQARQEASLGQELGAIGELFRDSTLRRNTVAALMMAVAGQGALWGIGFWSVDLLASVLGKLSIQAADLDRTKSLMFFVQQVGAMTGIYVFALVSQWTNRRRTFVLWFALGCVAIPVFFWGVALAPSASLPTAVDTLLSPLTFSSGLPEAARTTVDFAVLLAFFLGFATLGPFSGYTIYFPELYPTRLRATGCGVCYNGGRFLAALAPIALGGLTARFASLPGAVAGGMPMAATVVTGIYALGFLGVALAPETKGKPLPD
ncbi:MAG: MFS transporter [Acidobacteriota bacterium]